MEEQADHGTLETVRTAAIAVEHVHQAHHVKVHRHGAGYHVDLIVEVSKDLKVQQAHEISHQIKDSICKQLPQVHHVDIHVEPAIRSDS